jgi:hypothetical protein
MLLLNENVLISKLGEIYVPLQDFTYAMRNWYCWAGLGSCLSMASELDFYLYECFTLSEQNECIIT